MTTYPPPVKPRIYVTGNIRRSVIRFFEKSGLEVVYAPEIVTENLRTRPTEEVQQITALIKSCAVLYGEAEPSAWAIARLSAECAIASNAGLTSYVYDRNNLLPPFITGLRWVWVKMFRDVSDAVDDAWRGRTTPIETALWEELADKCIAYRWDGGRSGAGRGWPMNELYPQFPLGKYRVDFFITPNVVVECDGVTYHSEPEKVIKDKGRDRWFTERGFRVFRFSTPEIMSDPVGCAVQVERFLDKQHPERTAA